MRIQDLPSRPHNDGYIFVGKVDGDCAYFSVTKTHHEMATPAATPLYVQHPVSERLAKETGLKAIPVKVLFDTPEANIAGRYEAWADTYEAGPVCIGDGAQAKAFDATTAAWKPQACLGPGLCPRANRGDATCSLKARMQVRVETGAGQQETFELRTGSMSTYLSILGTLKQLRAEHGSLRKLPLTMTTWVKSTRSNGYESFGCARLALDGVVPSNGPEFNSEWECYGVDQVSKWLAEAAPTEAEAIAALPVSVPVLEPLVVHRQPRLAKVAPREDGGAAQNEWGLFDRALGLDEKSNIQSQSSTH